MPRQIDCEHAPRARSVAHADNPVVRLDAPPADGQSESDAGSIGPTLRERQEHRLCVAGRAAAAVLDIDANAIAGGVGAQRNLGALGSEFDAFCSKLTHRRHQHVAVGIHRHVRIDEGNRELASAVVRFK